MPNFTTEPDVREKFRLTDTTLVPAALVNASIDDAHFEILRRLDPQYDVPTPEAALVLGETLLAGAHLLRSIASDNAFKQKRIQIGGQRIDESRRFDHLTALAGQAEQRAWETLQPFLLPLAGRNPADVTESQPIFEEV